jgi:phosphate transport system substrate-binding protein
LGANRFLRERGDVCCAPRVALADSSIDIGMASRKIKPEEIANLSLGDMTSPANEFVHGLDISGDSILLFGFADSTGGAAMNQTLSENRAKTVEQQFEQRGVHPGTVRGFGANLPVASNDTDEGREKNRRVEIWVEK